MNGLRTVNWFHRSGKQVGETSKVLNVPLPSNRGGSEEPTVRLSQAFRVAQYLATGS